MNKIKKSFFCQNCGAQHVKWQGQCNTCKEWNSLLEEIISTESSSFENSPTSATIFDVPMSKATILFLSSF